jgi:hypothetical protein
MVAVELTGGIGKQKSKVAEVQCISFFCGFVHGRNLKHEEEISESSWSTHHSNGSDATAGFAEDQQRQPPRQQT